MIASEGQREGSFVMTTTQRESPGTSTTYQKERVPNNTARSVVLKDSNNEFGEAPSPCSNTKISSRASGPVIACAVFLSAAYDVKSTSIRPPVALAVAINVRSRAC